MSRTFKPVYRKSRAFDATCRCNGSCAYCRGNRLHSTRQREQAARDALKEVEELDNIALATAMIDRQREAVMMDDDDN